jgi:hypothetical protein
MECRWSLETSRAPLGEGYGSIKFHILPEGVMARIGDDDFGGTP